MGMGPLWVAEHWQNARSTWQGVAEDAAGNSSAESPASVTFTQNHGPVFNKVHGSAFIGALMWTFLSWIGTPHINPATPHTPVQCPLTPLHAPLIPVIGTRPPSSGQSVKAQVNRI